METIKISKESMKQFNHDKNVVGIEQKDLIDEPTLSSLDDKAILSYLRTKIGCVVPFDKSLDYPHGKMICGRITRIEEERVGYRTDLYFNATFTDGYVAEYAAPAVGFFREYYDFL